MIEAIIASYIINGIIIAILLFFPKSFGSSYEQNHADTGKFTLIFLMSPVTVLFFAPFVIWFIIFCIITHILFGE